MPGITGIISKHITGSEEAQLDKMVGSMMYEPFYREGKFMDRKNGFFVGHVAIEGSFADCMPVFNETKDLALFLTGECYMDSALINGLKPNHDFNPDNASYLIHLYEEQGDDFFRNLNGWCNGLILDTKNGRAILFNDRFGMRRLYCHESEHAFLFASEAKALLAAYPALRRPDIKSIAEFLVYDCVLENRTYFSDIFLLPQASAWTLGRGEIRKRQYFDPKALENQSLLDKNEFFEELSGTFVRTLPRYFHGDHISMSLTGGLDTRMIMACLNPEPGTLPCFTFGGKYRDILDVRIAPQVAETCGQTHVTLRLDDEKYLADYANQVERAIYITDGIQSVDKADVIYFNRMAREIAPIRMTGKYGSQVLKSVFGLQDRSPVMDLISPDLHEHMTEAKDTCARLRTGNEFSFRLYSEIPWWWNGFTAAESSQVAVRAPFLDNDFIEVLYRAPSRDLDYGAEFQLRLINKYNPKLLAIPTTGTHGGNQSKIISGILKNFYKALLIADKLHIRERLPYSLTHWVGRIDYWLSPLHLDRLIMGLADFRRYRVWYRDQLALYLNDTLLCSRTYNRPYWTRQVLERVVYDHTHGHGTYLREIRKVLQIELIHRVMMEDLK